MKNELLICEVLPGLGQLNAMLKHIMAQMGIDNPNEAIRRVNAGEWVVKMIVGIVRPTFKIVIDYGRPLSEMVAAGKYDWVDKNITQENFPVAGQGKQEREIVLFHFNRAISSDDAIKEMGAVGYRPAAIEELLALGEAQPELQRQYPIVALKSVWRLPDGLRVVPSLGWSGAGRRLGLGCFGGGWFAYYRFAAVRNV